MQFKKIILSVCCISLVVSGCGGRTAYPVNTYQPGDESKSCKNLTDEMSEIEGEINKRRPNENHTGKNIFLGAAGAFLIVPWFFMDFSETEKIENNAYRARYNYLVRIHNDKKCGEVKEQISAVKKPKC